MCRLLASAVGAHGDEMIRRGEADERGDDAQCDTRADVQAGSAVFAVLEQHERVVAERGERRVPTAETGRQQEPQLLGDGTRLQAVSQYEAKQQAPAHVDEKRTDGEVRAGTLLNECTQIVA